MCMVPGEDDASVLQDEKVLAATRPRFYMDHLQAMQPIFYPLYQLTGINGSLLAEIGTVTNYLMDFNDAAAQIAPHLMSLNSFVPAMMTMVQRAAAQLGNHTIPRVNTSVPLPCGYDGDGSCCFENDGFCAIGNVHPLDCAIGTDNIDCGITKYDTVLDSLMEELVGTIAARKF